MLPIKLRKNIIGEVYEHGQRFSLDHITFAMEIKDIHKEQFKSSYDF